MKLFKVLKTRIKARRQRSSMRSQMRREKIYVYRNKRWAILRGKWLTFFNRKHYWVTEEPLGYLLFSMDEVDKVNKNNLSRPGGTKIRIRNLNDHAIWHTSKNNLSTRGR